jgi:predicted Zn-dependent protease
MIGGASSGQSSLRAGDRINRTCSGFWICLAISIAATGCGQNEGAGAGPGRRPQALALTPAQELELGRVAFKEVLSKPNEYGRPLPDDDPQVKRVRHIALRIIKASEIEPLQREINLRLRGYVFEWRVVVLEKEQVVNAFCLPAGKMAVFTGILPVAESDDQLATVMSHEIAHALAHHSSERLARARKYQRAIQVIGGAMGGMDERQRRAFMGVLAAGAGVQSKSYDRQQESEADHIGLFLMTFAGYDPGEAVQFWKRMAQKMAGGGHPPEVLSDHPSDAHRIQALKDWVPQAKAAKKAFDEGRIAPARGR